MKQLYVVGMMLAVFGAGLSAMEEEASGALAGEGDNPLNAVVKLEVTVKPDIRYSWITMRTVRRRGLPPEWAIRRTTTMPMVRRRGGPPRLATRPTTTMRTVRQQDLPPEWATRRTSITRMARLPDRLLRLAGRLPRQGAMRYTYSIELKHVCQSD